jgi:hypothetical protein
LSQSSAMKPLVLPARSISLFAHRFCPENRSALFGPMR